MKKLISIITFLALMLTASVGMAADFPEGKLSFDLGKSELPADAGAAIGNVAEYLKATKDAKVLVSGYTDTSGDAATNAELAKSRAMAVADALKAAGVPEDSIVLKKPEEVEKVGDPESARVVTLTLAPAAAPAAAPVLNAGDTAWILTSAMLVTLMVIPGLALFYGGLVRAKNMLSVLAQVFTIFALITVLWAIYGYSLTFSGDGNFFGGLSKAFMMGIKPDTLSGPMPTVPEFAFVSYQSTFAAITVALIVGAFAERIKFAAVLVFGVLWFTFSYVPIAHMVWGGGLLGKDGALDFAGGTVVHINAGVAGLVGSYVLGKRLGFGREALAPLSLTLTMVGASLLWVGWFGFNAGSAGAANGIAGLAFINTIVATGAATLSWLLGEALHKGKPSMLGAASGAVAGLVAITPAAGFVGPMGAIVMGLICGIVCLWGVSGLKRMLKADDTCDVFGVHGVGGIIGAILTGVFCASGLGGQEPANYAMAAQVWVQVKSVLITIVWSGVVSFIAYKLAGMMVGLRVSEESEREGLDISSHGEVAYSR